MLKYLLVGIILMSKKQMSKLLHSPGKNLGRFTKFFVKLIVMKISLLSTTNIDL